MKAFFAVTLLCLGLAAAGAETQSAPPALPRVVSLSPSITEIIFLLGRGNCMTGRSSACDYPEEAKKLPVTGSFGTPFLEHLASARPDYVITTKLKDKASKQAIESLGAKVIMLDDNCLNDYVKCVKILGEILNCRETANAETARFTKALEDFKSSADKVPAGQRPKVYVEVWHRPLLTCGGRTFINEMIEYAGGINIGRNEKAEYFSCSFEWIMRENPDVIISPAMGSGKSGEIAKRSGWQQLSAVKNNRIYTGLEQDKLYRLGPRTIDGIAMLRKYIHNEEKTEACVTGSEGKTK
jgi:iron complex transport system substrate-binding protein